ncbi:hypothetical protein QTP88_023398 [Uroleucon formosanum]
MLMVTELLVVGRDDIGGSAERWPVYSACQSGSWWQSSQAIAPTAHRTRDVNGGSAIYEMRTCGV